MNKEKKTFVPVEEGTETVEVKENIVEETNEVVEPVKVETPAKVKIKKGIVTAPNKLNVREKPRDKAKVVCVLNAKDEVSVNEKESTKDWFKVTTKNGVDGFCMKRFITIKS